MSFDVKAAIDETVEILRHSIDPRIEIDLQICATELAVTGDPDQIQNAILNLGINARDAMPEGGTLTIAARRVDLDRLWCATVPFDLEPGPYAEICVTDTGTGIDAEVQAEMFEPFFTTKTSGEGTGLGLSAVHGAAVAHRGAVDVKSEVGIGSQFRLLLPLRSTATVDQNASNGTLVHGSGRILVVDDERMLREILRNALGHLGYHVVVAQDGEEALEIVANATEKFDVIFLDMTMPKLNGHDTFIRLKEMDPGVRVVLTTGFTDSKQVESALDKGALSLLAKPFKIGELSRVIDAAIHC